MEDLFIWIGLAAIVIVFLVAIIGRYVTVSPDTALIVSGSFLGNGTNVFTDKENNKMKIVRVENTNLGSVSIFECFIKMLKWYNENKEAIKINV